MIVIKKSKFIKFYSFFILCSAMSYFIAGQDKNNSVRTTLQIIIMIMALFNFIHSIIEPWFLISNTEIRKRIWNLKMKKYSYDTIVVEGNVNKKILFKYKGEVILHVWCFYLKEKDIDLILNLNKDSNSKVTKDTL